VNRVLLNYFLCFHCSRYCLASGRCFLPFFRTRNGVRASVPVSCYSKVPMQYFNISYYNKITARIIYYNRKNINFNFKHITKIFPLSSVSRPALGPTQPPVQWVPGVLSPGVKRGPDVMLTTHPHLMPRS
jgi:hypothetical protein